MSVSAEKEEGILEIYIHIPFCRRKCLYCDFLSFPAGEDTQRQYLDALLREIRALGPEQTERQTVRSVFFGGGTPSLLPPAWICEILEELDRSFSAVSSRRGTEVTLEANPGTLTPEKLRRYREAGISRLSLGCQSFNDAELRSLGRIHTAAQISETFAMAREAGFSNISVDLMSGLPGQTEDSWEQSLRAAATLRPEHISAYSLIIEEGTPFWDLYGEPDAQTDAAPSGPAAGEPVRTGGKKDETAERQKETASGRQAILPLPNEETERRMYAMTADILAEYGYRHYEISNYALPGQESVHNTGYWTGVPYIGFGLGASSLLGNCRLKNTDDLAAYLEDPAGCRYVEEELTAEDRMAEYMILGLRLMRGVSEEEFRQRFGRPLREVYGPVIRRHIQNGLLEQENGRIRLSRRGISLANVVMGEFL